MYVYRIPPHPQQRSKVTPLLQGFPISAEAKLITFSPTLGTTSVARVGQSAFDLRSIQLGQTSVARSSESRWDLRSTENGNSSVSKTTESRLPLRSLQLGGSSVSKLAQAALDLRSTLSGLSSILVQVFAEARLFFGSLFKGEAEVTSSAVSSPAFEASNLILDLSDRRSIVLKWFDHISISWQSDRSFRIIDLEMTKTGVRIDPVVIGDDFTVRRIYTGLPTGISIDTAWFTVKTNESDPDLSALIQKVITPIEAPSGHIVVATTSGGYLEMFFDPTRLETVNAIEGTEYLYDVQVRTTSSKIFTLEKGNISFIRGVTSAST